MKKSFFAIFFVLVFAVSIGMPQPVHAGGVVDAIVDAVTNVVAIAAGVVQGSLSLISGGSFSDGYAQGFCSVSSNGNGIFSPGGCQNAGGQIVSSTGVPCVANYNVACIATNACGTTNSGTYDCVGTCTAVAPPMPPNQGASCDSAQNNCGSKNVGTMNCGVCSAVAPADAWFYPGVACLSAPNQCGMQNANGTYNCLGQCAGSTSPSPALCSSYNTNKPTVSLTANPLVRTSAGSTTLTWTVGNATSCRHSSSDTSIWSDAPITPANDSANVSVTAPTTSFTISCSNASGVTNRTVYVKVQNDCSPLDCGGTAKSDQVCVGKRYNDIKGCGVNNCTGTRYCDFNWKETAL
ncbi:MAG: hypothetical protein PHH40_00100 [Candidatus Moranbacteria bacterium]|nr:hypothetical protein [Candidatus Moranbacteria bacterium]MDD3965271.1 hypothetical protein [Candidatus Moranbacteria bacterium]